MATPLIILTDIAATAINTAATAIKTAATAINRVLFPNVNV